MTEPAVWLTCAACGDDVLAADAQADHAGRDFCRGCWAELVDGWARALAASQAGAKHDMTGAPGDA